MGQAFLSAGVKFRELPKDTVQAPASPERGKFGVQGKQPGLPCLAGAGGWGCWWDVQHLGVFSPMWDVAGQCPQRDSCISHSQSNGVLRHPGVSSEHPSPTHTHLPLHVFLSGWSMKPMGQLQWTPVAAS